jgi:hypothetical protein
MAKKQTFTDKLKKKEEAKEYLKVVRAIKTKDGAWKFNSKMVEINDENRAEIYK